MLTASWGKALSRTPTVSQSIGHGAPENTAWARGGAGKRISLLQCGIESCRSALYQVLLTVTVTIRRQHMPFPRMCACARHGPSVLPALAPGRRQILRDPEGLAHSRHPLKLYHLNLEIIQIILSLWYQLILLSLWYQLIGQ